MRMVMGGPNAPLRIADSIPGIVDAIASPAEKSDLRQGREVRW